MSKLYCLVGKSGCGKSTIEKKLVNEYRLKRVTSTTSRPIREGEVEGVDYYYLSKEEFLRRLDNRDFVEYTQYNGWYYGIETDNIDIANNDLLVVVEPHGLKQLQEKYGDSVLPIYIYTRDKDRLLRSLYRENNPNCKEICRRFLGDIELHANNETSTTIHKVENSGDIEQTVQLVKNIIMCDKMEVV